MSDTNSLVTSLRELAESIRERCNGDGKAAMLVAGSFAPLLDEAANRIADLERDLKTAIEIGPS